MIKLLRDYVVRTIWCSPEQDNQIRLAAARLNVPAGDIVTTNIFGRITRLPTKNKRYHVFNIGQVHPLVLGLLKHDPSWIIGGWIPLTDAVNALPLFVDVYNDQGIRVPAKNVYYLRTPDRALVFCVEASGAVPVDYKTSQLYLRLYTNAFYQRAAGDQLSTNTRIVSGVILNSFTVSQFQTALTQMADYPGARLCFVNGRYVSAISSANTKIGDEIEIVHDASIKKIVSKKIKDLSVFTSIRDSAFKYLFHYPASPDDIIDYVDDIDVYVTTVVNGITVGQLVHQNQRKNLRMVTHRDYAVLVDAVKRAGESLAAGYGIPNANLPEFEVRLFIRHSGYDRPLVKEANRLFELYKLPDAEVLNSLVNADAVVEFWQAAQLENSDFTRLFDTPYASITETLVEDGLGYNAISQVLADSPLKGEAQAQGRVFDLPPGVRTNSTIYEYDATGKLLRYSIHPAGNYHITASDCFMIEPIVGEGRYETSTFFGENNISLPTNASYRVYFGYKNGNPYPETWTDVTGTDRYVVQNGVLQWLGQDEDYLLMVRTDDRFLAYEREILPVAGTIYLDLTESVDGLDRRLALPLGTLDVWLNGNSLVEGINLFVDFPRIMVTAKDYLVQPADSIPQKLTIRFTGLGKTEGSQFVSEPTGDKGFIEHGVLSNNGKFDIRDDKVLRITVDGKLKHRDDLIFSEQHQGVSVVNALNGLVYQVRDVVVPLRDKTLQETYTLRQKALERDQAVSDYLSVKIPQPERNGPSAIQSRHRLFSPFFSHLVFDLYQGQIDRSLIEKNMTDQEVIEACQPYLDLLKLDPLNPDHGIDPRLILIHPHLLETTVPLDVYAYAFLRKAVKLFGNNQISLNQHVVVNDGGQL